jgi:hypothetical protein
MGTRKIGIFVEYAVTPIGIYSIREENTLGGIRHEAP